MSRTDTQIYYEQDFAESLKELIYLRGISKRKIAEELSTSEVSVSRYINGTRCPNLKTLVGLADVLNVSLDTLVGRKTHPNYEAVRKTMCQYKELLKQNAEILQRSNELFF